MTTTTIDRAGAMPVSMLSYPLDRDDPLPPAIPSPRIEPLLTIERDGARGFVMTVANHSGTHIDTPAHVIPDGLRVTDFQPDEWWFERPVVVDLALEDEATIEPEHLAPHAEAIDAADIVLLRLGYGGVRRDDPARYSARCPGFSIAGATYLRESFPGLRAIGLDVPSFVCIAQLEATMSAHNVVLDGPGRRFLIIEDMKLDGDLSGLRALFVAPWIVRGVDSTPCAVYGFWS